MQKSMKIMAALLSLLASPSLAENFTLGDLTVMNPVAAASQKMARAGAGYMTISNESGTADRLISVNTDMPRTMIHDTIVENDVAKMVHIEALDIPAGSVVTLAPGGLHVMFMGLPGPLVAGDSFAATLEFENAGELEITFEIKDRAEIMPMSN